MRATLHSWISATKSIFLVAVLLAASLSLSAFAHQGATGVVKERMDMMGEIGKAMQIIGQMIKGEVTFDPSIATAAALQIRDHATMMPGVFPEDSIEKPSEALPAIWEEWDAFLAINNEMKTGADKLAEAASIASTADEIKAQFGMVGRSCGSCHEKFRLKK